jgi:hypothetical protein
LNTLLTGSQGTIEKGAIDGQTTFGNDLVKALKAAVTPRDHHDISASKNDRTGKARRKRVEVGPGPAAVAVESAAGELEVNERESEAWGILELLREFLATLFNPFNLFWNTTFVLGAMAILLFVFYSRNSLRTSASAGIEYPGPTIPQRLAAHEEMWQREQTELWNWLEERIGLDGLSVPIAEQTHTATKSQARQNGQKRQKLQRRELDDRLNGENMADREIDHAIQVTRERLKALERVIAKRKGQHSTVETPPPA